MSDLSHLRLRAQILLHRHGLVPVVVPALLLAPVPGFAPHWLWVVMVVAGCVQATMAAYFLRRQFGAGAPAAASPSTPEPVPTAGALP